MDWALAAICALSVVYGIMTRGRVSHEVPMSLWPVGAWAAPLLALARGRCPWRCAAVTRWARSSWGWSAVC